MAASGRLADLYGRRRMFLLGLASFGLASAACAAAPSQAVLIAAGSRRVPARRSCSPWRSLTRRRSCLPAGGLGHRRAGRFWDHVPDDRSAARRCAGGDGRLALGFLINIPVVALVLIFGARFIPESPKTSARQLDIAGLVLLTGGLATLVAALLHLYQWPLGPAAGVQPAQPPGAGRLRGRRTPNPASAHPSAPAAKARGGGFDGRPDDHPGRRAGRDAVRGAVPAERARLDGDRGRRRPAAGHDLERAAVGAHRQAGGSPRRALVGRIRPARGRPPAWRRSASSRRPRRRSCCCRGCWCSGSRARSCSRPQEQGR